MRYIAPMAGGSGSGYTHAAMLYLCALQKAGLERLDIHSVDGVFNRDPRELPAWAIGLRELAAHSDYDNALIHHLPETIATYHQRGQHRTFGNTVVETSTVPRWLIEQLNRWTNGLIVPSDHNVNAFIESGYDHPVHKVPHPLLDEWAIAGSRAIDLSNGRPNQPAEWRDRTMFLYVGTWNHRKNPRGVLEAYLGAFPEKDNGRAGLVLKLTTSAVTRRLIEHLAPGRVVDPNDPKSTGDIWVYDSPLSHDAMRWLYLSCDVYVSLHRGEGWGLGIFQAAASGMPVIYTGYSAPAEYLAGTWHPQATPHKPVRYHLKRCGPLGGDRAQFIEGLPGNDELCWAEPDLVHACHLMLSACSIDFESPIAYAMNMHDKYSMLSVGRSMMESVESMGGSW